MRVVKYLTILFICELFGVLDSEQVFAMADARMKRVRLTVKTPIAEQVKYANTLYIVSDDLDLKKDSLIVPDGCCFCFKGGSLTNGTLIGDFIVVNKNPKLPVFNNISLLNFKTTIKISWYVGERRILNNNDFNSLPDNSTIDFENNSYNVGELVSISSAVKSLTFENLVVTSSYPIRRWMTSKDVGTCKSYNTNVIWTKEQLPQNYVGHLIRIETADIVKYDDRNATLFKGVFSVIKNIDGHLVTITDSIEPFSSKRVYYGKEKREKVATSTYRIYDPITLNLKNCKFTFTRYDACLTIDVSNSTIDDCEFEATQGAAVLLNVTGHTIGINNCSFKNAWSYTDNDVDMAYGVQVNEGTNVRISRCYFHNNRRSVDFSGKIESRYCVVSNCDVYQDDYIGSGSALGGHSTSYGNTYSNNRVYGFYSAGIQCRGEKENVVGNEFYCRASGAFICTGVDTYVEGNKVLSENKYETDSFIYSNVDVPNNTLTVKNNTIRCRQQVVNIKSKETAVSFINNTVDLHTNISTNQTYMFRFPPKDYRDNNVKTNSVKEVQLIEFNN